MVSAYPQGPVHTVLRKSHSNSTGYGAFRVLCTTFDQGLSPPETLDPSDCSETGRELTAWLTGASNTFLLLCQLVFDFYLDLGKLLLSSEFCFSETFYFTTLRLRSQPTEFPLSHVRFLPPFQFSEHLFSPDLNKQLLSLANFSLRGTNGHPYAGFADTGFFEPCICAQQLQ